MAIRASEIYDVAIRYFSPFQKTEIDIDFIPLLNFACHRIINELKIGNIILEKELTPPVKYVEIGDDVLDVIEVWLEDDNNSYYLRRTDIFSVDLESRFEGTPYFYAFTNIEGKSCIVFDKILDKNMKLCFFCKKAVRNISNLGEEIELPNYCKELLFYCVMSLICEKRGDPRAGVFEQKYLLELEKINEKYREQLPYIRAKRREYIWYQERMP